jgi:hypothetical protein
MTRRRLTRTIALHLAFASRFDAHGDHDRRGAFLLGIATMSITMRRPFPRIRRNLSALIDGVRGFADSDFSLRLHV